MTTLVKVWFFISSFLGWTAAFFLQINAVFPHELFSLADFLGGLIGNAVYGVAFIVYFEKKATVATVGLTKRTYFLLIFQVIGAGLTAFVLLSLLRSMTGGMINIDLSSHMGYGLSVILGFFYSYVSTPEFIDKLFKRAQKKVLGDDE